MVEVQFHIFTYYYYYYYYYFMEFLLGLSPSKPLHISFSLDMGPVHSSTNSTPRGAYSPHCHSSAGNYSNTQPITV